MLCSLETGATVTKSEIQNICSSPANDLPSLLNCRSGPCTASSPSSFRQNSTHSSLLASSRPESWGATVSTQTIGDPQPADPSNPQGDGFLKWNAAFILAEVGQNTLGKSPKENKKPFPYALKLDPYLVSFRNQRGCEGEAG